AEEVIQFPKNRSGVWIYLAVEGGFEGERWLGSASVYQRGRLGQGFVSGEVLSKTSEARYELPRGVAGRAVIASERRDYASPPPLRIWPGPQLNLFTEADRALFFGSPWTVTSQSDRVGYRLVGPTLKPSSVQI